MGIRIYLDDERTAPWWDGLTGEPAAWVTVRNADDAIRIIETGIVDHISFDHDLGPGKTGYDVACWIEQLTHEGKIKPPSYELHTGNVTGAGQIDKAMKSAWKIFDRLNEEP